MSPRFRAAPPPGTRLILASEDLLGMWGARTAEGYRISAEWGEQKPEGWYEPVFTAHFDDDLRREAAQQERERIRAAVAALPHATSEDMRKIGKAVMSKDVRAILDASEHPASDGGGE